jgi:hypothetical protein
MLLEPAEALRSGGQGRSQGVASIERLEQEVSSNDSGAWNQPLIMVEQLERNCRRVLRRSRCLKEAEGKGDGFRLMLGTVSVSVAPRITDVRHSFPESGELRLRSRLPAMSHLVNQRMTQLRLADNATRIERE